MAQAEEERRQLAKQVEQAKKDLKKVHLPVEKKEIKQEIKELKKEENKLEHYILKETLKWTNREIQIKNMDARLRGLEQQRNTLKRLIEEEKWN